MDAGGLREALYDYDGDKMNAGQKSARRIAASNGAPPRIPHPAILLTTIPPGPLSRDSVCTTCLHRLSHQPPRRHAATAAAEATTPPPPSHSPPHQHPNPPVTAQAQAPAKAYRVLASPVLSRPPLLTRDLTSFEKAYYLYQKRLNERLALPFSRYFYYKKGTPGGEEWKRKIRSRKTPARDIGVYDAYGEEGWNDEVLVGDRTAERESQMEALIRDAEGKAIAEELEGKGAEGEEEVKTVEGAKREMQKVEVERPMPRVTEADRKGDRRSLDRMLDRVLYLLVKNKDGRWRFPEDRVYGRENLNQVSPESHQHDYMGPPSSCREEAEAHSAPHTSETHANPTPSSGRRTHSPPIRRPQHEHLAYR